MEGITLDELRRMRRELTAERLLATNAISSAAVVTVGDFRRRGRLDEKIAVVSARIAAVEASMAEAI